MVNLLACQACCYCWNDLLKIVFQQNNNNETEALICFFLPKIWIPASMRGGLLFFGHIWSRAVYVMAGNYCSFSSNRTARAVSDVTVGNSALKKTKERKRPTAQRDPLNPALLWLNALLIYQSVKHGIVLCSYNDFLAVTMANAQHWQWSS